MNPLGQHLIKLVLPEEKKFDEQLGYSAQENIVGIMFHNSCRTDTKAKLEKVGIDVQALAKIIIKVFNPDLPDSHLTKDFISHFEQSSKIADKIASNIDSIIKIGE